MKEFINFLFPKYPISWSNFGYFVMGFIVILITAYAFYLILRLLMCAVSSVVVSIKDAKVELKVNEESKESGCEKFGIPGCADYRYKSFYFGLRPYFQHIFELNVQSTEDCNKKNPNIGPLGKTSCTQSGTSTNFVNSNFKLSKEENEKFKKFYKAELLCYEYFERRKILNFFLPFINYKTLTINEVKDIIEKIESKES